MTTVIKETVGSVDFIATLSGELNTVRVIQINNKPEDNNTMVEEILEVSPKKLMEILQEYVKYGSAKELAEKLTTANLEMISQREMELYNLR